jgi:multidrug resistance efflux pump
MSSATAAVKQTPSVPPQLAPTHQQDNTSKPPALFRLVRIMVAIPLFLLSAWSLLPLAVVPVSSLAVVNARLSRVRSAVSGEALQMPFEAGDAVKFDDIIVKIRTSKPIPPSTEPLELERARKELVSQNAALDGQIMAAEQRMSEYDKLLREYSGRMSDEVAIRVRDAEQGVNAAKDAVARAAEDLKRSEQLEKEGLRAASFSAESRRKLALEERDYEARKSALEQLRGQAANLKSGYFVGQGVEQPRYLALRDETSAELGKLRRDQEVLRGRLAIADKELQASNAKPYETIAKDMIAVRSPVNGVVWSREVGAGQIVNETDDLFQVADAGSLHVDAWVDRRYAPQLSIGDQALVYLTGNGKQMTSRIVAIQASSRRRLDEFTTAIDLQPPHPDQYRVIIQLDQADRDVTYLGQSAKVMFPGPTASWSAKIYFWMSHL